MVCAKNTFVDHMIGRLGFTNVFDNLNRYPEVQPELLAELKPDFIFLSSEPYAFSEMHFNEFRSFCPNSRVSIVDGEMFSWYGSRLLKVPDYFAKLRSALGLEATGKQ
jgi:ABC-type Fe3+-hydroxamate transport system substrate-binding protein